MSIGDSSFLDLLKGAPEAPNESLVTIVGVIARSQEEGKFVLYLGEQLSLTLPVSAVKSHKVIGNSIGQNVVELVVVSDEIPDSYWQHILAYLKAKLDPIKVAFSEQIGTSIGTGGATGTGHQTYTEMMKFPWMDHKNPIQDWKNPWRDIKVPHLDKPPYIDQIVKGPTQDIPVKPSSDGVFNPGSIDPFSLAAQQQAAVTRYYGWHPIFKPVGDHPKQIPDDR